MGFECAIFRTLDIELICKRNKRRNSSEKKLRVANCVGSSAACYTFASLFTANQEKTLERFSR